MFTVAKCEGARKKVGDIGLRLNIAKPKAINVSRLHRAHSSSPSANEVTGLEEQSIRRSDVRMSPVDAADTATSHESPNYPWAASRPCVKV